MVSEIINKLESRSRKDLNKFSSIFLFGAGGYVVQTINSIGRDRVNAIFDNDLEKKDIVIEGIKVYNPKLCFREMYTMDTAVVLSTSAFQYQIATELIEVYQVDIDNIFSLCSSPEEEDMYAIDQISMNYSKIQIAYDYLDDNESKEYFLDIIMNRITHNPLYLKGNRRIKDIYKYDIGGDVLFPKEGDVIYDCGAYIGDTASYFIDNVRGCKLKCFEPFIGNYSVLEDWIKKNGLENRVLGYNLAISDSSRKMLIGSDVERSMQTALNNSGKISNTVDVCSIDDLWNEKEKIDYIKMDIEGEEVHAIEGAKEVLMKIHPQLMISAYHKTAHMWEIPIVLKSINPNYKIYLGHNPCAPFEPEYYCICE